MTATSEGSRIDVLHDENIAAWKNFTATPEGVQKLLSSAKYLTEADRDEIPYPEVLEKGSTLTNTAHRPHVYKWFGLICEDSVKELAEAQKSLDQLKPKEKDPLEEEARERERETLRTEVSKKQYTIDVCQQARDIIKGCEIGNLHQDLVQAASTWKNVSNLGKPGFAKRQLSEYAYRMRVFGLFPNPDAYYPCVEVTKTEKEVIAVTLAGALTTIPLSGNPRAKVASDGAHKKYGKEAFLALLQVLPPLKDQ